LTYKFIFLEDGSSEDEAAAEPAKELLAEQPASEEVEEADDKA
jgi:hypothetical protein